ncbi:MAG TPA: helix-turn-helix domain-containing protein [Candidatus Baltobacteraceae bacterium]|nr:helix-turn-helix domain-containing protein [Candidatus Baltobacteraceae bacterium]
MPARSIDHADIVESSPNEERSLEALSVAFTHGVLKPQLVGPDDRPLDLPTSLYAVLRDAVGILLRGQAVMISSLDRRLSTTEAGDLLGVSRQYLTRLIDDGQLACEFTGRHRRVRLRDLLDFRDRRDAARMEALNAMTAGAAAAGEYD